MLETHEALSLGKAMALGLVFQCKEKPEEEKTAERRQALCEH